MPIQIHVPSEAELNAAFARKPRGDENVDDYIDVLQANKIGVGKGLTMKTVMVTLKAEDTGEISTYKILEGSVDDDDPKGITPRTAKRRFGMAARSLGFDVDWRDGDDWIMLRGKTLAPDNGDGKA